MPGTIRADLGFREASIEATITRADGRVEKLGKIAYTSNNPLKMLVWRIGRYLRRIFT